ncbi:SURF1-domain-containing protein [Durotheca rogersii]|uniref:SURF1-domain-containing protein n=1 Tax=Durotheca rogersii TaxID=419775 RepID=UPI002220D13E|nr:SURF1-domain-containing protein [Durotheca rogersii]KAI5867438.1 SURF1-domain-containing protein [Durotheca rogersii]
MKSPVWLTPHSLARRVERSLEAQIRASHVHHQGALPRARAGPRPQASAPRRPFTHAPARRAEPRPPAEDPGFRSIVDNPPELVRAGAGRRHGPGLLVLALIPATAFVLGTWQVRRLAWKTELLARLEDRIVREPLPLPPRVDAAAAARDFDFRRVRARGRWRHDREMLVGPRMHDGEQGFMVVTPLERDAGPEHPGAGTVLVNRGWIAKKFRRQRDRPPESLPTGEVEVEGLIREPWKKNMFTPDNRPDKGEFYFPDVAQMAALTGSQPVWIEQTMEPDLLEAIEFQSKAIPIGRPAEVNLRNNHAQYIFTWYGLAVATSIMFYMVVKKPPTDIARRVRMNKEWS